MSKILYLENITHNSTCSWTSVFAFYYPREKALIHIIGK